MQVQMLSEAIDTSMLRIITFGDFRILLETGESYSISGRSTKLWNLFKFFLINKEKRIPPEIILDRLYPEECYEDPQNAVQNMIYRLRKLLTREGIFNNKIGISFSSGCYKLELDENIWLDFEIFADLISKAEGLKRENPQEAVRHYERALAMYTGELMPEMVMEDWVISKRAYFQKLFINSVSKLSKLYEAENCYDRIVQICQKAILIEPHEEEIYIILIENLLKIGKLREARKHYDEMVKIFKAEFGINPTNDMKRVYQLLQTNFVEVKNINNSVSRLLSGEESSGALFCEYRDFYAIYTVEKRRKERSGEAFCPVSLDFDDARNFYKSNTQKIKAVNEFKNIMIKSLRSGDVFTIVNNTKFIIMLPNLEFNQVSEVMKRVVGKFNANEDFRGINLETAACPSLPKQLTGLLR